MARVLIRRLNRGVRARRPRDDQWRMLVQVVCATAVFVACATALGLLGLGVL